MSYPITAIEDIDADEADALKAVGIRTAEKLLEIELHLAEIKESLPRPASASPPEPPATPPQ